MPSSSEARSIKTHNPMRETHKHIAAGIATALLMGSAAASAQSQNGTTTTTRRPLTQEEIHQAGEIVGGLVEALLNGAMTTADGVSKVIEDALAVPPATEEVIRKEIKSKADSVAYLGTKILNALAEVDAREDLADAEIEALEKELKSAEKKIDKLLRELNELKEKRK